MSNTKLIMPCKSDTLFSFSIEQSPKTLITYLNYFNVTLLKQLIKLNALIVYFLPEYNMICLKYCISIKDSKSNLPYLILGVLDDRLHTKLNWQSDVYSAARAKKRREIVAFSSTLILLMCQKRILN